MADYAPPSGPPPPQVPAGWKAIWDPNYGQHFFVNTHTKASQWDKPTEPVYAPGEAPPLGPPPGAAGGPPSYDHNTSQQTSEKGHFGSNNPYGSQPQGGAESDEAMARRLQAEEEARNQSSNRGHSDSYYGAGGLQQNYGQASPSPYGQQAQLPPRDEGGKKGLFSKLSSKLGGSSSRPHQSYGGGMGGYPQQQHYPQQGYGGGYPQQGYGGYPQQPMYGGGYGGGYGQQPMRKQGGGGGMGMMGGAALGLGAGVLGGAIIADQIQDGQEDAYQDGYDDGGGGDDGGDGGD